MSYLSKNGVKMKTQTTKLEKFSADRAAKSKIIAVMNNKGGCGKTTLAIALGFHLARAGYNVLFWDNDPQRNLTQRIGVQDTSYPDRRMDSFFNKLGREGFEQEHIKFPVIIHYPYFFRLPGSDKAPGKIGIMPGSAYAGIDANGVDEKLRRNTELDHNQKDIHKHFKKALQFYQDYFDYIVIDTSPAMEGNLLGQLAVRVADEVVCPIDGIDAAMGVKGLAAWIDSETGSYAGNETKPNMVFAMMKYQEDTKDLVDPASTIKSQNAVYRGLKQVLGDFLCENGIKELPSLRNQVYGGFGRKTEFDDLCDEIAFKISMVRPNFFDHWNSFVRGQLDSALTNIEKKALGKEPVFKNPYFERNWVR